MQCVRNVHRAGTRIGQASECFVYWKDPMTNDTWGLNFTSPIDAKQFRECCVSSLSRAASATASVQIVYTATSRSPPEFGTTVLSATVIMFRILCVFCPNYFCPAISGIPYPISLFLLCCLVETIYSNFVQL